MLSPRAFLRKHLVLKKTLLVLGVVTVVLAIINLIFLSLDRFPGRKSFPGITPLDRPSPVGAPYAQEARDYLGDTERLVIKTGSLNMVVEGVREVVQEIISYTQSRGGWVVESSVTEREEVPSARISVRVPAHAFDEAMSYFQTLAQKVTHEATSGRDVTEEYVDLQARLRNLEAAETQLLKIMERSGEISDVLAVHRELRNIRQQIEQTKGRIQYLEQSTKMATINVYLSLSEEFLPIPAAEKWRPFYVVKRAWHNALETLKVISYLLIWVVIYGIIWVPLVWIIWRLKRYFQERKR